NTFVIDKKASTKELSGVEYLKNKEDLFKNCHLGVTHTRWSTCGPKTDINSHPHICYQNKFSLVHNGIIENYAEIKKELTNYGIVFKSQTDTEVIVNLISYIYQNNQNNQNNNVEEAI